MKIHILSNGQKYGWGKLRSIFDFFFPYAKNGNKEFIRCEATLAVNYKTKIENREFFTFRAFAFHYRNAIFINPIQNFFRNIKEAFETPYPKLIPYFAVAVLLFSSIFEDKRYILPAVFGIAVDTTNGYSLGSYTSSWSNNYTVTGSNSYVVAVLNSYGQNGTADNNSNAATYNGNAMTNTRRQSFTANSDLFIFTRANGTGDGAAHALVMTGGGATAPIEMAVASYSGVVQSNPEASNGANSGSASVTTITANAWVVGGSASTYTSVGSGTSLRKAQSGTVVVESSSNPIASASSITLNLNGSNNIGLFSLAPSTVAYTVTIVQGAYTLTGEVLGLLKALKIALVQGSYALSGQVLFLKKMWNAALAQGAYILTGFDVILRTGIGYAITIAQGAYVLTGNAISVMKSLSMAIAQGAYTLSGQVMFLFKGWGMAMVKGTYALTGQAVMLSKNMYFTLAQGAYTLTGQALTMIRGVVMSLVHGVYTLTGKEVRAYLNGQLIGIWKKVGIATDRVWRKVSKNP